MAQLARIRARDKYTCQDCGIAVRTGEVDHILSLENGGDNSDENQRLLCLECHKKKTAKDRGYKPVTAFDEYGFPTDPNHHWNK